MPWGRAFRGRQGPYYLLVLPVLVLLFCVNTFPLLYALWVGLTDYSLSAPDEWRFVGLRNLVNAFRDEMFRRALVVTLEFTAAAVAIEFVLGLAVALVLNGMRRAGNKLLPLVLLPMMMTPIIVGLLWRFMLNDRTGLVNYFLAVTGVGRRPFLAQPGTALAAIVAADVWQWTPFVVLMLYSGLQSLPAEPYEAAALDGASRWQTFRRITLPYLRNAIVICLLIRGMDAFREYDKIYTMTYGGPGSSTESATFYIYRQAFVLFNTGFAAVLSLLILVITVVAVKNLSRVLREA